MASSEQFRKKLKSVHKSTAFFFYIRFLNSFYSSKIVQIAMTGKMMQSSGEITQFVRKIFFNIFIFAC